MKHIAHFRTVSALSFAWTFALFWVFPRAVQAGTLSSDITVYDWISLAYACALGLLGGCLSLIVALASDRRVVGEVLLEGGRNALVSPIAGAAAYLMVDAAASMGWVGLSPVTRFLVIVGAGWAGVAFFVWARDLAGKAATTFAEWVINRGKQ
jgi:hypothetical protein